MFKVFSQSVPSISAGGKGSGPKPGQKNRLGTGKHPAGYWDQPGVNRRGTSAAAAQTRAEYGRIKAVRPNWTREQVKDATVGTSNRDRRVEERRRLVYDKRLVHRYMSEKFGSANEADFTMKMLTQGTLQRFEQQARNPPKPRSPEEYFPKVTAPVERRRAARRKEAVPVSMERGRSRRKTTRRASWKSHLGPPAGVPERRKGERRTTP